MAKKKKASKHVLTVEELRSEYEMLFEECKVKKGKEAEIKKLVEKMNKNRARYEKLAAKVGTVPWWFVGLIHSMERSMSFEHHLHNGNSLNAHHTQAGERPIANPKANLNRGQREESVHLGRIGRRCAPCAESARLE